MRRFIVTEVVRYGDFILGARGYWIGPGRKSVDRIRQQAVVNRLRNIRRAEEGRYAWA